MPVHPKDIRRIIQPAKFSQKTERHADKLSEAVVPDSSTTGDAGDARGGANQGFQGFRGKYTGNAQDNIPYSEEKKEYITITTRTVTSKLMTWAANSHLPNAVPIAPLYFNPQGPTDIGFNIDESLQSQAINMYAGLFIDDKLQRLASNTGSPGWAKWRIKRIRFNVQFKHFMGSWMQDGYTQYAYSQNFSINDVLPQNLYGNQVGPSQSSNLVGPPHKMHSGMWVYRDLYGDFGMNNAMGNIQNVPNNTAAGNETNNIYWRSKKAISNQDLMLDLCHDGENFNFEREINSKGSYFIPASHINSNLFGPPAMFNGSASYYDQSINANISTLIAELEGVSSTNSAFTMPNQEWFNLLVVPADMIYIPTVTEQPLGTPLRCYQPAFKTMCIIKCEADWDGWDYFYGTNPLRDHALGAKTCLDLQEILRKRRMELPARKQKMEITDIPVDKHSLVIS